MRKFVIAVGALATLVTAQPREAHAQLAVTCVNCSLEVREALRWLQQFADNVQMIENQITFIENQIRQLESMALMLATLPFRILNDISGEIRKVQALVQNAEMLVAYPKEMIDHLGDLSGYGGDLSDIPRALAQENNAVATAFLTAAQARRAAQDSAEATNSHIFDLQAQEPTGQTSAIQIVAQVNAATAQQQHMDYAAMMASFQAAETHALRQVHREVLLDTRALQDQYDAITTECGNVVNIAPPACQFAGQSAQQLATQ